MTPFPYVGAALEVGDYLTHWPLFRWLGYACSFAGLRLGLSWQWRARRAPVAVTLQLSLQLRLPGRPGGLRGRCRALPGGEGGSMTLSVPASA